MYLPRAVLAALFLIASVSTGLRAQDATPKPPPGPCSENTTCADTQHCKETSAVASQCPVYNCSKNQWIRYGVCNQTRSTPTSPRITSDCPRNCREKP